MDQLDELLEEELDELEEELLLSLYNEPFLSLPRRLSFFDFLLTSLAR